MVVYLLLIAFLTGVGVGGAAGFTIGSMLRSSLAEEQLRASSHREAHLRKVYDALTETVLQNAGINVIFPGEPLPELPGEGWFDRKLDPNFLSEANKNHKEQTDETHS